MDKVLVVDDEPSIRNFLKTILTNTGYEVIEAANGEQGFETALDEKPDLIIADIMMPIKDGYELARDLRSNPATSSVPIIMLTALHGEQDELKAFQEGIDDYVTKPFSAPVLRARVATLLARSRAFSGEPVVEPFRPLELKEAPDRITSGYSRLDEALGGGLPRGSNVLLVGETGSGKSSLCRRFLVAGLRSSERCMMITLDDEPAMIRRSLDAMLSKPVNEYEREGSFRLVDGYSWSRGSTKSAERFAVSGVLELNQLAGVISDAGMELGQGQDYERDWRLQVPGHRGGQGHGPSPDYQAGRGVPDGQGAHPVGGKAGGRRVLDSISSLFINFELAPVQRFVAQLARTATSYGGVTTLFVVEEGAITEQTLNNMKYVMDGLIQFRVDGDRYYARVANMKWTKFSRERVELEE